LVKIFEGLRLIGEAIAAADGEWSLPWLGSPGMGKHAFRATGSHGHHHDTPVSAGAPSIAGISDSIQGSGGKFAKLTTIENPLPTMIGFGHAGDLITVFDGDRSIGSTTVHADGTWAFSTPLLAKGTHDFFVSAVSAVSGVTLMSNHLVVHMVGDGIVTPSAVATITSALDEFIDPAGNHHDNVIQNGAKTFDTSPKLLGKLDAALNAGETLVVYRDGMKVGLAAVSGLGWSFQDTGLTAGEHIYTARVESSTGVQGAESADFGIVEGVPGSIDGFPMLLTDNFLIFDTRGISRMTSDGKPMSFDLLEAVKSLEAHGMTVSYTDKDGFISIGVDWMSYLKAHPDSYAAFDFVAHRHVDNDKGGLDLYDLIGTPLFTPFVNMLDTWIPMPAWADGRVQPSTPPAGTFITGIYDVYTDESGNPALSLIPNGGPAASSTHKIVLTFSEPLPQGWIPDRWEIYRDGVRLLPNKDLLEIKYDQATNTGWVIETNVPPGPHVYTARVPRTYGDQGAWSESYSIVETGPVPVAVATITNALDEFTDPDGNHHQTVIQNGSTTPDASPKLVGSLSAALQAGEALYVYRDGKKIGKADVSGNGWSFEDSDLTSGKHVYTAQVESALGVHGVGSEEFSLTKDAIANNHYLFPILATEDYLIVDIRLLGANSRGGQPATFDFEESVRFMKLAGLNVETYTQTNDFISFKVDWMSYAATHPWDYISLISHDHVENAAGGLDYYNSWGTPHFSALLDNLGSWTNLMYFMDGAGSQSALPPVDVHITGIYDDVLSPNGESIHTLIPEGGATSNSTHTLVGTLSGPIPRDGGVLVIYRDGEIIAGGTVGYSYATISGTEWSFEDRDVPPGHHVYTAHIARMYGKQGTISDSYNVLEADPIPTSVATIISALDEFTDPGGNQHQTVIENGSKTLDASPKLLGTLSAKLLDGEALYIYRDGVKLGHADVSGHTWSFQDASLAAGSHTYTARVESSSGAQGALSSDFSLIEATAGEFEKLPLLVTEHFLILDVRGVSSFTASGKPILFDLTETVNGLNKLGLAAKINSTSDGYISIEVDWMAYAESHPAGQIDFVLNLHIDNDNGGLNYYKSINVPSFGNLLRVIDSWVPTNFLADGAEWQLATPAPATVITGVYDSYTSADGKPQLTLVPAGGGTAESAHRIEGTLSEPMRMASDWLVIYRDGVKLSGQTNAFEQGKAYSDTTWWFVDTDVPPGPHVYTARVERAYGKQGDWSESYDVLNTNNEPLPDAAPPLLMLTEGALIVDVHALTPPNAGSSGASLGLSAELVAGGKTVAVLAVTADAGGLVYFAADWKTAVATHPDATLKISALNGPDDTATILDAHALGSLLGQTDRWVSMTPTGESAAFFDTSDRSVHIHGGAGIDTIAITGDHQVLDLTSLTGKTTASTVMGIEKIDLGGQHNTLKIAMIDVLNLGETDLYREDGKQQFMVNGKAGDSVILSNTRVAGIADGSWEQQTDATIGGVKYNVYEHSTAQVELMVQANVELSLH